MNQNQMMGTNGYPMPNQNQGVKLETSGKDKKMFYAFIACIAVLAIGCFLPFLVQESMNLKMNYISSNGDIKDGVFVIALGAAAIFCAFKKKYIVALILQIVSFVLFIIDAVDALDRINQANEYISILGDSYKIKFGIGFYLVLIGIVGSLITIFLLWRANKGKAPVQQTGVTPAMPNMQQPMQPQVPVQNNCPYCGTPKNPGSPFCTNCGAKF